jgi:hypothetical protein
MNTGNIVGLLIRKKGKFPIILEGITPMELHAFLGGSHRFSRVSSCIKSGLDRSISQIGLKDVSANNLPIELGEK